jgi:hypothetical protein
VGFALLILSISSPWRGSIFHPPDAHVCSKEHASFGGIFSTTAPLWRRD